MFEIVYDGRRTDGRTPDPWVSYKLTYEPRLRGELKRGKKKAKIDLSALNLLTVIHLVVLIVYKKFRDFSTHRY